jgi:hypothetical protein
MSLVEPSNLSENCSSPRTSIKLDSNNAGQGIAKLVLSIVKLLTDVLERQALRRYDEGTLSTSQIEELGTAFLQINTRAKEVAGLFGIKSMSELQLNLNPNRIGGTGETPFSESNADSSLADLVDLVVDRGAVVAGNVSISVANVELIVLDLLASIRSVKGNELT